MKKWIAMIVCLMLAALMVLPAMAEGTTQFTITPSKTEAIRGDEITFTVSVSGSNACKSFGLALSYDASVFEMVSGSFTAEGAIGEFKNGFVGLYTTSTVPSGNVCTFTLKVKADAPFGAANVSGTPSVQDGDTVFDSAVTGTSITVSCVHSYDNDCDAECNGCGQTREAPHAWNEGTVTVEPSCTTGGSKTVTCTACSATKEVALDPAGHKYDNGCDADCNVCGATREITHTYGTEWKSDANGHWHICSVCGAASTAEAHTPGPAATEWQAQKCTVCAYVIKPALAHTCNFEANWTSDSTGHWHACRGCDDIQDYQDHVFDNVCDSKCDVCNYVRTVPHNYDSTWKADANGHWQSCTDCGAQTTIAPHEPGPEATLETPQLCLTCGYELAPSTGHTHKYDGEWVRKEQGHARLCSCGKESEITDHNWDPGVITREPTSTVVGRKTFTCLDCGEKRTENVELQADPGQNAPDVQDDGVGFPWWILIVIVAVPVLGFALYIIIGVIKGQKQKGRFTQ